MNQYLCPSCKIGSLSVATGASGAESSSYGCDECAATFPIIWGVPYLGQFSASHIKSVIEIASSLGQFHVNDEDEVYESLSEPHETLSDFYDRIQSLIADAETIAEEDITWQKYGFADKPNWFPQRHAENAILNQLTSDFDFTDMKVLDIGAGTGFDANYFAKKNAQITALEYSPLQAGLGKQSYPEFNWIGGSAESIPFENETFDFVIACNSLHHIMYLHAALNEMLRVLKPGGSLLSIGDSFSPDSFTEVDEAAFFNNVPSVLMGVNEQVPHFSSILDPLVQHRASLEIEVLTSMVREAEHTDNTFRAWGLDESLTYLNQRRGILNLRVRKTGSTKHVRTPTDDDFITPAAYAKSLTSRGQALTSLAPYIEDRFVDLPLLGMSQPKLQLLCGWKLPQLDLGVREAVSPAYFFMSGNGLQDLSRWEFQITGSEVRHGEMEVKVNNKIVERFSVNSQDWAKARLPTGTVRMDAGATVVVEFSVYQQGDSAQKCGFIARPAMAQS